MHNIDTALKTNTAILCNDNIHESSHSNHSIIIEIAIDLVGVMIIGYLWP